MVFVKYSFILLANLHTNSSDLGNYVLKRFQSMDYLFCDEPRQFQSRNACQILKEKKNE